MSNAGLVAAIHRRLRELDASVAAAESLTGGLVAAALTDVPGSSATFRGGVVAYATALKGRVLGVPADLLAERGAVDPDVAVLMARGAARLLDATYGVSTTGVAGPDPQDGHPVGTVYVAVGGAASAYATSAMLTGDRAAVRAATVRLALQALAGHIGA